MNSDTQSRFSPSTQRQYQYQHQHQHQHQPSPSHRHPYDSGTATGSGSSTSASRPSLPLATTSTSTSTSTTDSLSHDTRPAPAPAPFNYNKSSSTPRRTALPFNFPFFQLNNKSVTSLVPSTAEGKPIPLDDSTAAHRTSALRELNSNFPSPVTRHKYSKSSGAQSSTYSQPVIVRTYSGPSASNGHSRSNSHTARRRGPPSTTSTSVSYVSPVAHSRPAGKRQHGGLISTVRENAQKKMPWPWLQGLDQDRGADKLPPHDAFSFKTIMANLQAQSNEMDKALDGIAEIYARSRYSLSNQYEVHVAPHGSGSSFISAVPSSSFRRRGHTRNNNSQSGPTLQAIQSDDDDDNSASARSQRRRRGTVRRRSAAYGTLETIMSSSRSSEEDKTKKKSASELTDEVRGRASSKPSRSISGSSNPGDAGPSTQPLDDSAQQVTRRRSKSFANAIIFADTSKSQISGEAASPRNSSAALVSEPSMPQTSSSHLEIRTTSNELFGDASTQGSVPDSEGSDRTVAQFLQSLAPREEPKVTNTRLISGLGNWVPWKTGSSGATMSPQPGSSPANNSHAEGSLRELLKTVDDQDKKGKSVDRVE